MADLLDIIGVPDVQTASKAPTRLPAQPQDPLLTLIGVPSAAPAGLSNQAPAGPVPVAQSSGFGAQLSNAIADVPRQLGLTARHTIEGVGGMLDTLASPIRGALNLLPGVDIKPAAFPQLADALHLPTPQNATERVVGDASRMLASSIVPIGVARGVGAAADAALASRAQAIANGAAPAASNALRLTVPIADAMSARPELQGISAAAAGGAGGYTRETGGTPGAQALASLVASVAAPAAVSAAGRLGAATQSLARRIAGPAVSPAQIDERVNSALQDSGLTMADLPANVQTGIRSDVAQAMKTDNALSPDAVRRLADYHLTGTTPTAATLSLDPAAVSQQKNLAKLGVNSKDVAAQQLAQVENANNRQLISGLNDLGAGAEQDAVTNGGALIDALTQRNNQAQSLIDRQYAAARASDGRSALLDHEAFVANANKLLDQNLLGGKVPSDVRKILNRDWTQVIQPQGAAEVGAQAAADGVQRNVFNVDTAEQIKTTLADLQRISTNGPEIKALGLVRRALDETPLLDGQEIGQDAINSFNQARALHKNWMEVVEATPALQAVRAGADPDKFIRDFVIGNTNKGNSMAVAQLKSQIADNPDAMNAVRRQITSYLKSVALNGASDEVGNFSQSSYNKALNAIGDRKLRLFFPQEDLAQLKAIGRVAGYEQFQPRGAAVNNSNTASAGAATMLDRIGNSPLLSKVPFGKSLAEPAQNIALGMKSKAAMNVPKALLTPVQAATTAGMPATGVLPGLLMQRSDDKRQDQPKGLLFP